MSHLVLIAWWCLSTPGVAASVPGRVPIQESDADGATGFELQRIRRARRLRSAGLAASTLGPPVVLMGAGVIVVGAIGDEGDLVPLGALIAGAGLVGSLVGPPVLHAGGALARGVARRRFGERPGAALAWASGGLFLAGFGSTLAILSTGASAEWVVVPVTLWGGGVFTGAWSARAALDVGEDGLVVVQPSVSWRAEGAVVGLRVSGRW